MTFNTDITAASDTQNAVFGMIKAKQAQIAARVQADGVGSKIEQGNRASADTGADADKSQTGLSNEEQRVVDQLRARDREVRDHEQAHKRVGGPYASQPTYSYQVGPDGQRYAVGGQVMIDASPVADNPEATIAKMLIVKAAALAPAEPSSADRNVAAMADAQMAQAQADLTAMRSAERRGESVDMVM